jgi:DNA-directed RNA polymerase subunit RPC12/RpoP
MEEGFPSALYTCPNCGRDVDVSPQAVAQLVSCPHCAWEFIVPSIDGSTDLPEDVDALEAEKLRLEHLSNVRVRQLTKGRSATYRTRNWIISAMLACALAVIYLPWWGLRNRMEGRGDWQLLASIPLALAAIMATVWLYRRARELTQPLEAPSSAKPRTCADCGKEVDSAAGARCPHCGSAIDGPAEPDFSGLGDGSQKWKNLEQMTRPPDDTPPGTGG